ncbi:DUF3037 domain-containing protein [Neptuniibacter sp.]|uniref:DUF3037 domain-containing protein n=1 Tax=Neptuniibacter sp. TaxID=1962643 RepID=UPI00262A9EA3|nr:DUF3037 domain-containing protein [Neptuniibacter sp.]MCP4596167.1 DUF3037 domain-containing protein [Neptuniibacter sp.]
MATWYRYTVLRVCPDKIRGEIVNVGICVVCPDGRINIHMPDKMRKAAALDSRYSADFINEAVEGLISFAECSTSIQERESAILFASQDNIRCSEFAEFRLDDPDLYHAKVGELLKLLVTPVTLREKAKIRRITTTVKNEFMERGLLAESGDINEHLVVAQYPIDDKTGLKADFALKNSVMHITQTIDFNVKAQTSKLQEAALDAVKLDMATRSFGDNTAKYVLYSAKRNSEPVKQALSILEDHTELLFNLESATESKEYFDILARAAAH